MHIYIKIKRFQVGGNDQICLQQLIKSIKKSPYFFTNIRQSYRSTITQLIGHIQFILLEIDFLSKRPSLMHDVNYTFCNL